MIRAIVSIALCAVLPAAFAEEKRGEHEAKKMEHFAKMKDVKLEALRGRITVMQTAASCVQSAQNPDAMRGCEEQERSAMEQHTKHMKERWESLKPR